MSQFLATLIGAALGVIAGTLVQFGAAALLEGSKARRQLADISAEAVYNMSAVQNLISEVGRLRASAQPQAIAGYFGVFRFSDILWIAMNQTVQSGRLYRAFNRAEIERIQGAMVFFSQATGTWVTNRVNQIKAATDVNGALNLANYIEAECRKHLSALQMLRDKAEAGKTRSRN